MSIKFINSNFNKDSYYYITLIDYGFYTYVISFLSTISVPCSNVAKRSRSFFMLFALYKY